MTTERAPVFVRVEIDGKEQRRQAVPHVLLYDRRGLPQVVATRPELAEGEQLVERRGKIPQIIRVAA